MNYQGRLWWMFLDNRDWGSDHYGCEWSDVLIECGSVL